jgi:hypothetical protein
MCMPVMLLALLLALHPGLDSVSRPPAHAAS